MKTNRETNKNFTILLFAISFIFAYFLLHAGSLAIKQIPDISLDLTIKDLIDEDKVKKIDNEIYSLNSKIELLGFKNNAIQAKYTGQKKDIKIEKEKYKIILASRYATQDAKGNIKIEKISEKIDKKISKLQAISLQITALKNEIAPIKNKTNLLKKERRGIYHKARNELADKKKWNTLKAFSIRLSFVLPLLIIAFLLLRKYRKSDYWPFVYGWGYFSAYAFFIELVPYFPVYGGYVKSIVGVVVSFVAGKFIISKLRVYLAKVKTLEKQNEKSRRLKLQESEKNIEESFDKIKKNICPSCDRKFIYDDNKYCVYCGLCIQNHCHSCDKLQISFTQYCLECGAKQDKKVTTKNEDSDKKHPDN